MPLNENQTVVKTIDGISKRIVYAISFLNNFAHS
jgi:hypothetical protein